MEKKIKTPFIIFNGKKLYLSRVPKKNKITGALFLTKNFNTLIDNFWGVIDEGIIYRNGEEIGRLNETPNIDAKYKKMFLRDYGIMPNKKQLLQYKLDKNAKRFFLKKKE